MSKKRVQKKDMVVLIPGAGCGMRMKDNSNLSKSIQTKILLTVMGRPLLFWTVEAFRTFPHVSRVIVAVDQKHKEYVKDCFSKFENFSARANYRPEVRVISGGCTRSDTVRKLFEEAFRGKASSFEPTAQDEEGEFLTAIHDGVRPAVSHELIHRVAESAREHGAAVPLMEIEDTIKVKDIHGDITDTLDRDLLGRAQTPQIFHTVLLAQALKNTSANAEERRSYMEKTGEVDHWAGQHPLSLRKPSTDEATMVERLGHHVAWVEGEPNNMKLTWSEQIPVFEALIRSSKMETYDLQLFLPPCIKSADHPEGCSLSVGLGFDAHRFVSGRSLYLGSVEIPHKLGLEAHSDGDVVIHALADALLGAVSLGDIGAHFPPDAPETKNMPGASLMKETLKLLAKFGCRPCSVDLIIIAQRPTISPYRERIRKSLAKLLGIPVKKVSVKASSTEGLGFTGRGEGIAVQALALVECYDSIRFSAKRG